MVDVSALVADIGRTKASRALLVVGGDEEAVRSLLELVVRACGVSPFDHHRLVPEGETITVAAVRDLRARLSFKPHSSPVHLVSVPDAHRMTAEAQSALLKTLEEPPAPTVFVLAVPDADLLLETVVSRCLRIRLGAPPSPAEAPSLRSILSSPLPERLSLADRLAKDQKIERILDRWILEERDRLQTLGRQTLPILERLLKAKRLMTTQANRRLLLEQLFLAGGGR